MNTHANCFTLIGLLALLLTQDAVAQPCNPGIGGAIGLATPTGVIINHNGRPVLVAHVGDTINITSVAVFTSAFGGICGVTNGQAWVGYPDNSFQQAMKDFTLASSAQGGSGHSGPSADPVCLPFSPAYTIKSSDINKTLSFTTNNGDLGITCQSFARPNEVQFAVSVLAQPLGSSGGAIFSSFVSVLVISPAVSINAVYETNGPPGNPGSTVSFHGTVRNTGDANSILNQVVVSGVPEATITFSTTTAQGNPFDPVVGNLNNQLVPGDSVDYVGSFPANSSGPFTLSVTAQDVTGLAISDSAPAPHIVVAKLFGAKTEGGNFVFSFATESSRAYTIQFTDSLSSTSWQTLTNLVGDGTVATIRDGMTSAHRFYRAFGPIDQGVSRF